MIKLSRINIAKRSTAILVSLISLVIGIFIIAKSIEFFHVNAITSNGGTVSVTHGSDINYGDNYRTNKFTVSSGGNNFTGFCANPSKATPDQGQSFVAVDITNSTNANKVKLITYIATVNNATTRALMSQYYGTLSSDADVQYAYAHATIGRIYGDSYGLTENMITVIDGVINDLNTKINNSSDVWLMAKNYKLFQTNVDSFPGVQAVIWIEDNNQYGSVKVQKCDSESQSCTAPQGKASFAGITFEIYNASGSRIYNPKTGNFYNNNAKIASGTTGADGTVTFSNLPVGVKYRVKETSTNSSYLLTTSDQTMSNNLTTNGVTLNFYDQVVRGDVKFIKTSDVDGEPMANVVFKIKSTSGVKEEHLVVTDEDGVVDTSASHALHSFHTNGYDDMEEDKIEYFAYGTWFGSDTTDDTRGALPYDTYEITELKCDANKFCYDIGDAAKTVTIDTDGEVVDLEEWSNDCADFSITTTATDKADGDKILAYDEDVEIVDTVDYCLKKDMEFTIKGIVMNKNTKEPLLVNGKKVEQTITLTPNNTCGTTEMVYSLSTKDLGGTDLVIFEELYYGDELILSHSDFNNASQTVSVAPPPPDTGAATKSAGGIASSDNTVLIIFAISSTIGTYIVARSFSRRRFLGRKR